MAIQRAYIKKVNTQQILLIVLLFLCSYSSSSWAIHSEMADYESTNLSTDEQETLIPVQPSSAGVISENDPFYLEPSPPVTQGLASNGRSKSGIASYYHARFNGKKTSTGEVYNSKKFTLAAHVWSGKEVCVEGPDGTKVDARVTDRGPFEPNKFRINKKTKKKEGVPHETRSFDLSEALMKRMGGIEKGEVPVKVSLGSCYKSSNSAQRFQKIMNEKTNSVKEGIPQLSGSKTKSKSKKSAKSKKVALVKVSKKETRK